MLLLTLLFVSSAVATPLLGTEQCARGPPYWCKNVKTASLCGAVPHCQQSVWNKPQLKTVPCDLCKEIIVVVDQIVKDNATQSEILGYLEKACQLIPDEGLTAECKELVDSYYPILIGIIIGELEEPGVVCGAMGLCRSEQAALAQLPSREQLQSNEIPKVDLSQVASPFMLNIPQLLYPEEITKKETPKKENDAVCDDCLKFVKDAQEQMKKDPDYVSHVIATIEAQCDLLGPGLSDMCKQYISQYAPMIIAQFENMEKDAKDLCSRAGFCAAMKKSVPMVNLQPAMSKPAFESLPALKLVPATKRMVKVRESPQCAICEFVMNKLEETLEDETTEKEVIEAVEKVCTLLPSSLTAQCKDLVETYGQAIIELLVQQADPKTVCTVLGLCSDPSRQYVAALDEARFNAGGFCEVCKLAVNYIDGILEQNATEAQIEEAVKKVCNFLPKAYQTECDQLIEQYEPMLVQMLLQMMDPDFVCMKVGACPGALKKLLGREQCSWGPAFWCKSMETATRCNAVEHCKRHVW